MIALFTYENAVFVVVRLVDVKYILTENTLCDKVLSNCTGPFHRYVVGLYSRYSQYV